MRSPPREDSGACTAGRKPAQHLLKLARRNLASKNRTFWRQRCNRHSSRTRPTWANCNVCCDADGFRVFLRRGKRDGTGRKFRCGPRREVERRASGGCGETAPRGDLHQDPSVHLCAAIIGLRLTALPTVRGIGAGSSLLTDTRPSRSASRLMGSGCATTARPIKAMRKTTGITTRTAARRSRWPTAWSPK
jgi:hypothetical protein